MELRPAQADAWKQLRRADFGILSAPTGWGKSVTLCSIVGRDKRVVIAIPQKIISKGFVGTLQLTLPNGREIDYQVSHNLCEPTTGKMSLLKTWLTSGNAGVVVTTHQALAQLWSELSDKEKQAATDNTSFVLDEAHHIHTSDTGYNQLGSLVRYVLQQAETTRLILATAYFFRGDCLPIIDEKELGRFTKYYVPFDEFWRTLKYLKSYRYDFVPYRGTVWKDTEKLLHASNEPTLFYCPWEGHKLLTQGKEAFVSRLVKIVNKTTGAELWSGGLQDNVIIDLTSEDYRNEKVKYVIEHGDKVRAILAVSMMREGADWLQCSRVMDFVPSSSNQDRMQRFGRLVRDNPGKKQISYFSFLPHIADAPADQQREQLTRLYAHFHASLVLEHALAPIKVVSESERKHEPGAGRPVDLLGDYDEPTQENILHDAHEALITVAANGPVSAEQAEHTLQKVLAGYTVPKRDRDAMARQIVLMFRRSANYTLPVNELVKAGFDKVWSMEVFNGLVMFSGGVGGPENFKEIRSAIGSVFDARWMENFDRVSQLPEAPRQVTRAGHWCDTNRREYKAGRLSVERQKLLESVPWWYWWKSREDVFDDRVEECLALSCPPLAAKSPGLFKWIMLQKQSHASGKLPARKIAALRSIPWWTWDNVVDAKWEQRFQQVAKLNAEPSRDNKDRTWLWRQAKSRDKLTREQIKKLDSIPWFRWDVASKPDVVQALRKLKRPPKYGEPLYDHVKLMRSRYRHDRISRKQVAACETISWWTW